jgi:hypothetical protein
MADYTYIQSLKHYEKPAKVDERTGETTVLNVSTKAKQPKDKTMMYFPKELGPWGRTQTKAWDLLETQTTDLEFKVAFKMARLAKAYTNSLEPLNPSATIKEILEFIPVGKNDINKVIDKLFKLGVIGKFEVYDRREHHHNYWIFNPYLHFNGKSIKKGRLHYV